MDNIINAYFTNNGVPALGLTPTIRIWEVDATSDVLVVNSDAMSEIDDGFYKFEFGTFDPLKDYLFRADGGITLPAAERFSAGATECAEPERIADAVWDETKTDHLIAGSFGESLNIVESDVSQLRIDVIDVLNIATLLVKFQANRTVIDKIAKTLTIYDDDGTTPIHVFDLFDGAGSSSVTEVCERVPQ